MNKAESKLKNNNYFLDSEKDINFFWYKNIFKKFQIYIIIKIIFIYLILNILFAIFFGKKIIENLDKIKIFFQEINQEKYFYFFVFILLIWLTTYFVCLFKNIYIIFLMNRSIKLAKKYHGWDKTYLTKKIFQEIQKSRIAGFWILFVIPIYNYSSVSFFSYFFKIKNTKKIDFLQKNNILFFFILVFVLLLFFYIFFTWFWNWKIKFNIKTSGIMKTQELRLTKIKKIFSNLLWAFITLFFFVILILFFWIILILTKKRK